MNKFLLIYTSSTSHNKCIPFVDSVKDFRNLENAIKEAEKDYASIPLNETLEIFEKTRFGWELVWPLE